MNYSKSEIKELSLNQFSESQLKRAFEAFNGIAQLFGKDFIDIRFKNCRCPSEVIYITETWENWKLVEPLKKSEEILKRWKEGFYKQGIIPELDIFAHLVRCGIVPDLFPDVGSKKADCKINYNNQIIYVEVTRRDLSEAMKKVNNISTEIHDKLGKIFKGRPVKVEILRLPTNKNELNKIINWLQNMRNKNKGNLDDIVCFSLEGKIKDGSLISIDLGSTVKKRIIKSEIKQLPEDYPGIICLDTSVVGQEFKDWVKTVEGMFQSSQYERLGAIFLYNKPLTNKRTIINGYFINNSLAKYPIDSSIKCIFEKMFNTNE